MNQKSCVGEDYLGFKKVSGRGNHNFGEWGKILNLSKKNLEKSILYFWKIYILFNISSKTQEILVQILDNIL